MFVYCYGSSVLFVRVHFLVWVGYMQKLNVTGIENYVPSEDNLLSTVN